MVDHNCGHATWPGAHTGVMGSCRGFWWGGPMLCARRQKRSHRMSENATSPLPAGRSPHQVRNAHKLSAEACQRRGVSEYGRWWSDQGQATDEPESRNAGLGSPARRHTNEGGKMAEHERCVCGCQAYVSLDGTGIGCEKCLWRAPDWDQWDRMMGAARGETDRAARINRAYRRECAKAAMQGIVSNGLLDTDSTFSKIAISAWKQADAMLAAEGKEEKGA